jgi:3-hydroxyisobutyrate dehydrogenase
VAQNDTTVAVLGTGIMGAAMARNLAEAGIRVRAWNRTRSKAEPLAASGVEVAGSPTEAAQGADFLLTMLSDADAIEQAVGVGALEALDGDGVWLQMSTVGVEGTERLAALASDHGVAYVDAPVLGTKQPAEARQLAVLASGPEEVRERCGQVFDVVGAVTMWIGRDDEATRLKLVVNNWILGMIGTLAETIAFAKAVGVDPSQFLKLIEGSPLDLPYAQMAGGMMLEGSFPTSFPANMAFKDAGLVLRAEGEGLRMPLAEAAASLYEETVELGHGDEDVTAVYRLAGRANLDVVREGA